MKIFQKKNVYEAAIERIEFIFSEFDNIIVSFSGGKDSTVTLFLALEVARKLNRLPLKVFFLDQEAEWQATVDYVRMIGKLKEVNLDWMQVPIQIFNATSTIDTWLMCWEKTEGIEWMREKEPNSIKENVYGTLRFKEFFGKYLDYHYPNEKACFLGGVRALESPGRFSSLTQGLKYKHITWGKRSGKKGLNHYTFYPIYDWDYTDVWKYIFDNNLPYCKMYDYMYRFGEPIHNMRVSNLHHETAVHHLEYVHEVERETWETLNKRIRGVNTTKVLKMESYKPPKELPYMFESWKEYRDYLLENLIEDKDTKSKFSKIFSRLDEYYYQFMSQWGQNRMCKVCVASLLVNDYHQTKIINWEANPEVVTWKKFYYHGKVSEYTAKNKYIRK